MEARSKSDVAVAVAAQRIRAATKNPERVRVWRERLINAAIEVFIEKGFHNATVRDIGRAANMTQGTIYNYVRSKDDILYLVCDRIVAEYNDQTRKALEASRDPVERVRLAVRAISKVMYRHRREILLIYQDSHLLDTRSRRVILARVEEFIGMFERIVSDAAGELEVPLRHPHLAANILTFLPAMIALRGWSLKHDLSPDEVIDEISRFVVRGLGLSAA
ncbi:MAG TPA: TetR/AcrR family transcriptional regulator [Casimicrobiaceae bacterium]|nr:TetR/AcrR family transcriptional regulator [Casimicrobiaceae bacterium]